MSDRPNTAPMPTSADISTRNAIEPINDRTGTVRLRSIRSTHQRQMDKLAVSGKSLTLDSPEWGRCGWTRFAPKLIESGHLLADYLQTFLLLSTWRAKLLRIACHPQR